MTIVDQIRRDPVVSISRSNQIGAELRIVDVGYTAKTIRSILNVAEIEKWIVNRDVQACPRQFTGHSHAFLIRTPGDARPLQLIAQVVGRYREPVTGRIRIERSVLLRVPAD